VRLQVPEPQDIGGVAGGEGAAVGGEGEADDVVAVPDPGLAFGPAGRHVPDLDGAAGAGADQLAAVPAEGEAHRAGVPDQRADERVLRPVPQPDATLIDNR
jgi:hypothetical protein